jgi:hypothetical protein
MDTDITSIELQTLVLASRSCAPVQIKAVPDKVELIQCISLEDPRSRSVFTTHHEAPPIRRMLPVPARRTASSCNTFNPESMHQGHCVKGKVKCSHQAAMYAVVPYNTQDTARYFLATNTNT